jgi:DNA-binding NarL/FixJ family response regulator
MSRPSGGCLVQSSYRRSYGQWWQRRPKEPDDAHVGPIRVLLADDHRAFVDALTLCLRDQPGLEIVASAVSADEALVAASARRPDVVLVDIDLAGVDGVQVGATIKEDAPDVRLVALTGSDDVPTVARALRAGFAGWVAKDVSVSQLVEAIRAVCRGETWVPGSVLSSALTHIFHEERDHLETQAVLSVLTVRESDVLSRMTSGAGRKEIAAQLSISENTVRTHMQSILAKLGVHSSLAAVAIARRAGLP